MQEPQRLRNGLEWSNRGTTIGEAKTIPVISKLSLYLDTIRSWIIKKSGTSSFTDATGSFPDARALGICTRVDRCDCENNCTGSWRTKSLKVIISFFRHSISKVCAEPMRLEIWKWLHTYLITAARLTQCLCDVVCVTLQFGPFEQYLSRNTKMNNVLFWSRPLRPY